MENESFGFRVFVPGTSCNGILQPEFKVTCAPGNETWPVNPRDPLTTVRWVTDQNVLESVNARGPSYTAVIGSGIELSSIENPCGSGWMFLASGAGDADDRDQVQVYELVDGQMAAASAAMSLPGPVTALWPAERAGQSTLVIRNSKTGNYEAARLGVACTE
jgi:hypothetical protein